MKKNNEIDYELDFGDRNDLWIEELNDCVHEFFIEDPTVVSIMRKHEERSAQGMKQYKTSIFNNTSKSKKEWVEEAIEEALDLTIYLQRLLEELERE